MNTNQRRFIRPEELERTEKYLDVHGQILRFASPRPPRTFSSFRYCEPLSERFLSIAEALGRCSITHGDLDERMDDADAKTLWELICERASQLPPERWIARWSTRTKTIEELDTLETVLMIAAVMAEGLHYSSGDARLLLGRARRDDARTKRWLRQTSLKLTSALKVVTLDFRGPIWLAKRSLSGHLRVLCRHYANILQILFHATKRATGRFGGAHIVTAIGSPWFGSPLGHAWNWLVRSDRRKIIALDLTMADNALDCGRATSIINPGLDATRWANASSFALTLLFAYLLEGTPLYRDPRVLDALSSMFDLSRIHGQMLLFNVIRTGWLDQRMRRHLAKRLSGLGFLAKVPAWESLVAAETSSIPRAVLAQFTKDQTTFEEVLSALLGKRCVTASFRSGSIRRAACTSDSSPPEPYLFSARPYVDRSGWPMFWDESK